jgi:DNA-binding response OmpR family regulator
MGVDILEGKRVLVVDDEPDVAHMVEALLTMCEVRGAASFSDAKRLLEQERFDLAVLDIMGVDGYALLELANRGSVIAVMLTAHALSPDNIVKSFKGGAASYLPKEKLTELPLFLSEVLKKKAEGSHLWSNWLERWGKFYDKMFGPDWKDHDKEFWDKIKYWI